jgi:hypothetical protein
MHRRAEAEDNSMKPALAATLSLSLLFAAGTGRALAQFSPLYRPGLYPAGTPGLNPYLDLTRGGNRAVNYFLGTLPEIERRRNAAQFGAAIYDFERRGPTTESLAEDLVPTLPGTGHPVAFMSFYPYYNLGPPGPQATRTQPAPAGRKR